jgi:hypothetical protein
MGPFFASFSNQPEEFFATLPNLTANFSGGHHFIRKTTCGQEDTSYTIKKVQFSHDGL